ncbi:MAG: YciI family protein [Roseiflexaceae bacterium]
MSDITHYLYRIQPTRSAMLSEGPTEAEAAIVAQHFGYLKGLAEQGVVVLAGRTLNTDPSSFGIIILRADTEAEAAIVAQHFGYLKGVVVLAGRTLNSRFLLSDFADRCAHSSAGPLRCWSVYFRYVKPSLQADHGASVCHLQPTVVSRA